MSEDPEQFNLARPYECRGCHTAMRSQERDGYCLECSRPEVRCRGYQRASGAHVRCGRLIQAGHGERLEAGQCPTCAHLQGLAWKTRGARIDQKLLRDRERRYGGPAPGDDVFRGFREE